MADSFTKSKSEEIESFTLRSIIERSDSGGLIGRRAIECASDLYDMIDQINAIVTILDDFKAEILNDLSEVTGSLVERFAMDHFQCK